MSDDISSFIKKTFDVDLEIFVKALKLSPNAQGYISGAITELLLKQKLESDGYEVKRIKEKWEGDKHPNHHGDFYVRKNGTSDWFVLESKGVKSNSEKWHKLNQFRPLKNFLTKYIEKFPSLGKQDVPEFIEKLFPGFQNGSKDYELKKIMEKITVLETHFVSGAKSKKSKRTMATPRKDEFHVMSLDLFLRTGKHEFVFANSSELIPSKSDSNHLQQNYIIDILITGLKSSYELDYPWHSNFNDVFETLKNPVSESDMQIDDRSNS